MSEKNISTWIKQNKVLTGVICILAGLLILYIIPIQPFLGTTTKSPVYDPFVGDSVESIDSPSFELDVLDYSRETTTTSTQLDVREGRMEVKTQEAENDFEILKNIAEQKNGHIETSSKNETNILLTINAKVRIPSENFDEFVGNIEKNFEVEDFQLSNYKIEVQQQIDELDIIEQAIRDYNFLREETLKLEDGEERINLLSSITREMQYLAQQQRDLERRLGSQEEKSELSTINIVFKEKLTPNLWPEDLGHTFLDRINWGIEEIATTFVSLLANSFVLLVKVVEYIIYATIIILPISFAWKLFKNLKNK